MAATPEARWRPRQAGTPVRLSRRRFAALGSLATGAAILARPASIRAAGIGWEKDGGGGDGGDGDDYTGPLYGYTVSWDPASWGMTSSAEPDMDYEYDFVSLYSGISSAMSQVQHIEVPFDDLDEAADGALDHYVGAYGMTRSDVEVLGEWASDDAVGVVFYWLGYDDNPYTYIQYFPTEEDGVWCVSYIQVRGSEWDPERIAEVLPGIWVDDEPLVRAAGIDEITDVIDDDI